MNKLRTILVLVGLLGGYATLFPTETNPTPPNPDPNPIIVPDVVFPSIPTKPSVLPIAKQIPTFLASESAKSDALIIAKTFRDWAVLLAPDKEIRTTLEFRQVFLHATKTFFSHRNMLGKYPGLDSTISNIITESLRNSDPSLLSGKENVALNTSIREAYKQAMNAVSWGAYQAYLSK